MIWIWEGSGSVISDEAEQLSFIPENLRLNEKGRASFDPASFYMARELISPAFFYKPGGPATGDFDPTKAPRPGQTRISTHVV